MKNRFVIGIFLSTFLLISPKVNAANFKDNQTVDSNKIWTIEFTSKVGFDDATKQGITITDSKGNTIPVGLQLGQDEKTILVATPQGGYKAGESYILNISSKIHSNKGKVLKNQYKVHFNIKSTNCIVTFKDKNLEKAIRDSINKPIGDIFKSDVEKITFLDLSNKWIHHINGIENLTNLGCIRLINNPITDISLLKELTNLTAIELAGTKVNDISVLKGLTKLQFVNLGGNVSDYGIPVTDISALTGLNNLSNLYLSNTSVTDITPLKNSTKLRHLFLDGTQVTDISALKELTNLEVLYLKNTKITDADKQLLKNILTKCNVTF